MFNPIHDRASRLRARVRTLFGSIVLLALSAGGSAHAMSGLPGSGGGGSSGDGITAVTSFGSNPGALNMYKYVPDGLASGAPLVVALHGCTQGAKDYNNEPGWMALADAYRFALLLPEQTSGNNANRCFNWFQSADISRGQGEAASIISMVDYMIANHGVDAARVYVTGLSAGGAMTSAMLGAYPERFAGGGIVAGIPYKCAVDMGTGFTCMSGLNKSPQQWGDLVRNASSHTGPWPRVAIWQGSADTTVDKSNANEAMEQWTNVHGIDQTPDATETFRGHSHRQHLKNGQPVVDVWYIQGMGHGTPVDPGSAADQCGSTAQYMLDYNICSSYYLLKFWGVLDGSDTGGDPGGDTGGDAGYACTETTDSNYGHVTAGRATQRLGYVYAVGSGDSMGLYNTYTTTTLAQTQAGYYELGSCP